MSMQTFFRASICEIWARPCFLFNLASDWLRVSGSSRCTHSARRDESLPAGCGVSQYHRSLKVDQRLTDGATWFSLPGIVNYAWKHTDTLASGTANTHTHSLGESRRVCEHWKERVRVQPKNTLKFSMWKCFYLVATRHSNLYECRADPDWMNRRECLTIKINWPASYVIISNSIRSQDI